MEGSLSSKRQFSFYIIGLVGVIVFSLFFIFRFAENEAEKGLETWEARMSLIADSRADEVSKWLNRHLDSVENISGDASVELYVSTAMDDDDAGMAEAQRGYIYSLLSAEAEANGFHEQTAIDAIQANVTRPQRAGLALINRNGQILVASSGMPILRPNELRPDAFRSFIKVGPALEDKTPLVLFAAPVSSQQGQADAWVVGARPLDKDFLATLAQPGDYSTTSETYLVVPGEGDITTPITPQKYGGRLGVPRVDEAASLAANQPNGFANASNYADRAVLVTGRELTAPVNWVLVRTIERSEALSDIVERRNTLFVTLSLAALVILVAMILVWRHGVSRRLSRSYEEQTALSEKNEALSSFLRSVSDSQPAAIAALDTDMTARFANKEMALLAGVEVSDLENRRLDTAFDKEVASDLRARILKAAAGATETIPALQPDAASNRKFRTQILPLEAGATSSAQALLVMQDITDLMSANAKTEALFRQLVSTLTQIIDARDPWSRHHSHRVADVAVAIAADMGWSDEDRETIEIAGQLVNLGKIFVPIDILTKENPLSDEELALVRDSVRKGADLITDIPFNGPVANILKQIGEHWDGSGGPEGILAEAIEPGARILSVANTFVGIVSARAHRASLGFDKAIDILHSDAGTRYDRRVIAALQNILENKNGRDRWAGYMQRPE